MKSLIIHGAQEHNLRALDIVLPHDRLILITGVSGSGKSSLAFDTIFKEGERRYFATLSERARALFTKIRRPQVRSIEGVRAAIAVDQRASVKSPRSTVGTLSELSDGLRLLFARFSKRPCAKCGALVLASETRCECGAPSERLLRAHFSFNSEGACPQCQGLGVEDRVDPELLIADPQKSLREGALVPTLPNGYIVYSQVTPDSLDTVCKAHGFSIDTPFSKLSEAQRQVIFFGSDRVKVPFGKHTLESRMKWSGIKAKPRSTGHYRGLVNVLSETLAKSRNDNVMRFVRTSACSACEGSRLSPLARAPKLGALNIAQLSACSIGALDAALSAQPSPSTAQPVLQNIRERCDRLAALGLGHLSLDRASATLSGGEARRLRLAQQLAMNLTGLMYVLDEPSAGAHLLEREHLAQRAQALARQGNTVIVVEHDPAFFRWADHIVQIGPGAGHEGGRLLEQGPPKAPVEQPYQPKPRQDTGSIRLKRARTRNLKDLHIELKLFALNVITGVSGAGKSSLLDHTLARALRARAHGARDIPGAHDALELDGELKKAILVSQGEIGRTPRSNPATYSGAFDLIRALFAAQPQAKALGLGKGHFSFNKKGGRCERCEGAGVELIGMMSLPTVYLTCEACEGRRFLPRTLEVKVQGRSILDVLQTTVKEARAIFKGHAKLLKLLDALDTVGLGYLPLGQPATTLSGGEAQRLKLAKELARSDGRGSVLLLDEPCAGLHPKDIQALLRTFNQLIEQGATIIVAEHAPQMILAADHVIDLGPGAGPDGGQLVFSGPPQQLLKTERSRTAQALRERSKRKAPREPPCSAPPLRLRGVTMRNLKGVDVRFAQGELTVVTGRSGSGKSSLVFDTLAAEGKQRFAESVAPYLRKELRSARVGTFEEALGMRASVVFKSRAGRIDPRSTVGTRTKLDPKLRLLFARMSEGLSASHFSFNHPLGACERCSGAGQLQRCAAARLVPDQTRSIAQGALGQTRAGRLLFELEGRFHATLLAMMRAHKLDPNKPYGELSQKARTLIERGDPSQRKVVWEHAKQRGEAKHTFEAMWPGALPLIEQTWAQKRGRKVEPFFAALLAEEPCPSCQGERLGAAQRAVRWGEHRLPQLRAMTFTQLRAALSAPSLTPRAAALFAPLRPELIEPLERLIALGLGYLTLDRATDSLSGGELGRLDLATQLVEGLVGVCYVLDEPCAGLHHQDRQALASALLKLARQGNVVVCVEHDETLIRAADHIIDLGPDAGAQGGQVVAQGDPDAISRANSPTGRYLSGAERLRRVAPLASHSPGPKVKGANARNLKNVDLSIRYGELLGLCGVSGSGKSTLMFEVLAQSLETSSPQGCRALQGQAEVIRVQPRSVATGPTKTVATFLGLLEPLAKRFAKAHGLKKGQMLFTSRAGQCPACQGSGQKSISMDFLPDAVFDCELCGGDRFSKAARQYEVFGQTLPQLLAIQIDALCKLELEPKVLHKLSLLQKVGLCHLSLGRSCSSLSSGERQRLQIAGAIEAGQKPRIFLFDEPARGLHFSDQQLLLELFESLCAAGHAVVFCEHAPGLLACADRLVELGPGAGPDGGQVIFDGPPRALKDTPTGLALARPGVSLQDA